MNKFLLGAFCLLASFSLHAQMKRTGKIWKGNDASVRYIGRTVAAADGSVSFDWVGTYFETRFTGGLVDIMLSEKGTSYYNVFVDGELHRVVKACGQDTLINFVSGVSKKWHSLCIQKRTEGEFGRTTIHGFRLASSGSLQAEPRTRKRHIEFIGNSLTCGFGTEGKDKNEPFKLETENCNYSFSTIIPRYFDADYTLIAHSGRGVVRNYGDSVRVSAITMKDKMLQTFDEDTLSRWDFSVYSPDLVVINLGSNDFSTEPHPYKSEFIKAYMEMFGQLRKGYGDIPILCIYSCTVSAPVYSFYEAAVEAMHDDKIYLLPLKKDMLNTTTDLGAVWHPSYKGHQKMAMQLIPYISTIMGWDLTDRSIK